ARAGAVGVGGRGGAGGGVGAEAGDGGPPAVDGHGDAREDRQEVDGVDASAGVDLDVVERGGGELEDLAVEGGPEVAGILIEREAVVVVGSELVAAEVQALAGDGSDLEHADLLSREAD